MTGPAPAVRAVLALALAAGGAACGSSTPADPSPDASTAAPTPPSAVSRNMTLMAHLDVASLTASDVHAHHDEPLLVAPGTQSGAGNWGYTAPDGRRFALTGTSAGLSVVEVTDPAHPHNVGLVRGEESQWREVKTYSHYAYVTTEATTGLDIVDLADPTNPRKVQTWNKTFTSAHTLWADAEHGLLYVNGANGRGGKMHVLDVGRNPEDPVEVGTFDGFYVHDSIRRGNVLFASAIFDGFLAMLDVTDPSRIREITRFPTGGRFTHNSWPTTDGRFLFTTDERTDRPVEGWDLADPAAPRKVSEYIAKAGTIPHNVMVDGGRMVLSHYTEGVRLLDVRDPAHPSELGFYDTFEGTSGGFAGAWGAYIFPGSNIILVSDINSGLWVVRYDGP